MITLALGGCASMENRLSPAKVDPMVLANGSGIVVISSGAAKRCISTATMLNVARAGSPYGKNGLYGVNVDAYVIKSDFPDHQGSLSAFELKPGNYQLYPSILNPYVVPVKIPKAEFSVKAGEVVYIGEFFMPEACSFSNVTQLNDEQARDVAILRERNPQLAAKPLTKRIAVFTGYVLGTD
jgi:hypothetical protein